LGLVKKPDRVKKLDSLLITIANPQSRIFTLESNSLLTVCNFLTVEGQFYQKTECLTWRQLIHEWHPTTRSTRSWSMFILFWASGFHYVTQIWRQWPFCHPFQERSHIESAQSSLQCEMWRLFRFPALHGSQKCSSRGEAIACESHLRLNILRSWRQSSTCTFLIDLWESSSDYTWVSGRLLSEWFRAWDTNQLHKSGSKSFTCLLAAPQQ
jgi:hypothetical protein